MSVGGETSSAWAWLQGQIQLEAKFVCGGACAVGLLMRAALFESH